LREGGASGCIGGWFREGVFGGHKGSESGDGISVDEAVADLSKFLSSLVFDGLEVGDKPFEGVDTLGPVPEPIDVGGEVIVAQLE
jgi:hypothetical protein